MKFIKRWWYGRDYETKRRAADELRARWAAYYALPPELRATADTPPLLSTAQVGYWL